MKLFKIIFIICLTGCGQVNQSEKESDLAQQTTDTTSQNDYQKKASAFPDWLIPLYPNKLKLKYRTIEQELNDFKEVNDSVAYCTFKQMDGVCTRYFLKTYVNRKQRDRLEIGSNCDHDLSQPIYSWKDFEIKPSNTILMSKYTKSVHDSLIDENGKMKEAYTFLEADVITDTTRYMFQVDQKGIIKEITNSY